MQYFPLEKLAYIFSARSRQKKYAQFLSRMHPTKDTTILDVGVNTEEYSPTDNFLEKHYPHPENITVVATDKLETWNTLYPEIRSIKADGRALPFEDDHFDIA